jgi:CDP-diacylglycerol--glycerol-3-phosphate 3-phosphatidyltransferase
VDLYFLAALFGLVLIASVSYAVRVSRQGRARFERVDRQGGSLFLAKPLMEMGYWSVAPIARGLVSVGFTANRVTWLSFYLGALAGICMASGAFGLGALAASFAAILDMLDGMIARETGTSSRSGKVLDSSLDRYVEFFFLAGVAYYFRETSWILLLALLAIQGAFMVSYTTALSEIQKVEVSRGSMRRPERLVLMIAGAASMPFTSWVMVVALGLIGVVATASALLRMQEMRRRLAFTHDLKNRH